MSDRGVKAARAVRAAPASGTATVAVAVAVLEATTARAAPEVARAASIAEPQVVVAAADRRTSNLVLSDSEAGKAGRARPVMVLSSSVGSNEKLKPNALRFRDMCSFRNDRGLRRIASADQRDGRDAAFHRPHAEKSSPKRRPRKGHGGVRLRRQRLFQQCFRVRH